MTLYIFRLHTGSKTERMTDPETGMGNLQYFKHRFINAIDDTSRHMYYIAYIIMDSSYLRSYHGYMSFDEVLRYGASVILDYTSDDEICARITENGFVYVFRSENDAKAKLKNMMNYLNQFEEQSNKNNKLVFHCAVYHLMSSDKNGEILLFNLRKNCNRILGTEKQIVYCDIHSMNRIYEEKKITESIINGIDNKEFKMYLQFVVDNKTKKAVSAEALSRWDRGEKGFSGPGEYIKIMEETGLIAKHDFYMLDQVCRKLEQWDGTEFGDISISCNFTRITLSEDNFIDKIKKICESYKFDRTKLAIEITEDAMEKDIDNATENVRLCKELGLGIYLDDMGGGYTSLSNLCNYPIDVVKIDRDILLNCDTEKGRKLFRGIVALAHSLNIRVIGEGVETEEQNHFVNSSDCDCIQGWYYSKPIPESQFENFVKEYSLKYNAN